MLSIGGGVIRNFTLTFPYFQHWGDEPRPRLFQVSKLSEDQKQKKVFTRNGTLFSPNSSTNLRSDAPQSQIIEGDAGEDHTQIVGGNTVKLLGGIYPLRGFVCEITQTEYPQTCYSLRRNATSKTKI